MHAAVVSSFDSPPRCADVPEPVAQGDDQLVVEVLAAGLHPRVRSQANGSHYTSTDALPLVPGIDGVGRDPEGRLRYFVMFDTPLGSFAERTAIDRRRSVVLPDDADPVTLAAAMNPAMSAWIALRRRIGFAAGQSVLVLGATGNAGRLAIEVARLLGAGRVVAAGRDAAKLAALPADAIVRLGEMSGGDASGGGASSAGAAASGAAAPGASSAG
ncbi:zinc-binding alcohol dehydrogenase family protein, partial [Conexibacter sp. JD483]